MAKKTNKELSFEEKLLRIEEIVKQLESGSLSLSEALDAYKEAAKLGKELEAELDKAESELKVAEE